MLSQTGLGASHVQEAKIVVCVSKTLTRTEERYTNIKKEMPVLIFGIGVTPTCVAVKLLRSLTT